MISLFSFYLFPLYNLKNFFFFNGFLNLASVELFMISILPLTMFLVFFFYFSKFSKGDNFYYLLYFFFIFFLVGLSFLFKSPFMFLLQVELCVFPMSFLILNFSKDSDKISAVKFMLYINLIGSVPFMIFSSFIFLNFFNQTYFLGFVNSFVLEGCFIMVLMCKLPIFLTHFWLTKAHVSASGSCSMILASIMLKLGSFGMYKFFSYFIFTSIYFFTKKFLSISILGCLIFSLVMLRVADMKLLVACSSIMHMALIFPLLSMFSSTGVFSSMFMMTGHGFVSYFLFFLLTLIYEISVSRSYDFNKSLESNSKIFPFLYFLFFFLNLGVPPFINFFSEFYFSLFLIGFSIISMMFFSLSMVLSIMFVMFIVTKIFFGKKILVNSLELDSSVNLIFLIFTFSIFFLPYIF